MKWWATIAMAVVLDAAAQEPPRPAYDTKLARELGADERGMKMYALVLLRTGPRTDLTKEEIERAFAGHMANINRLAAAKELAFAGPLERNERYRGIFILNVKTVADAEALVSTDPAVAAGLLAFDTYLLYGSAALLAVNEIHSSITKD
jgi:uncharacterized protein YciI